MSGLYTPFGRAARWVVRRALGPWTVQALEETPASAVFLVHHQNLFGPIHAMAFLPREVRLWVLSPFCDRKACFEQYYGYTFTRRFGWPRPAAWAVSRLLSFLLPGFLRQFRVIPVWRGSLDIRDTFARARRLWPRDSPCSSAQTRTMPATRMKWGRCTAVSSIWNGRITRSPGSTCPSSPCAAGRRTRLWSLAARCPSRGKSPSARSGTSWPRLWPDP